MQKITRVVVANDGLDGMESALAKAAMIEHYTGAEVRALTVIYDTVAEEPPEVLPEEQQVQLIEALKAAERQGLRNLAAPYRSKVAEMDTQVLWSKYPKDAILDAVKHAGAELLIKPVCEHHPLGDYLHAPLDWMLMREAPCAVLVSRRATWGKPTCVLAAVDVTDVRHMALTREVLTTAATLAGVLGVPLHLATAYPTLGQGVGDLQVAMDYAGIKADMRANRSTALAHWIESLQLGVSEAAHGARHGRSHRTRQAHHRQHRRGHDRADSGRRRDSEGTMELTPAQLRRQADAALLGFGSTAEIEPATARLGQGRAQGALDFAMSDALRGLQPVRAGRAPDRHARLRARTPGAVAKQARTHSTAATCRTSTTPRRPTSACCRPASAAASSRTSPSSSATCAPRCRRP
jgi:hypothetical protein